MPRPKGFPDWSELTAGSESWARRKPGSRGRVLFATNIGGMAGQHDGEHAAAALAVRGADVEIVLCDGILPGCSGQSIPTSRSACWSSGGWRRRSARPVSGAALDVRAARLKIRYLSELVTLAERRGARACRPRAAAEIATSRSTGWRSATRLRGALRYFAKGIFPTSRMARRCSAATRGVARQRRRLSPPHRRGNFDVAVFHHGSTCRRQWGDLPAGRRAVVNWFVAYRANSFILSHDDTYHHT